MVYVILYLVAIVLANLSVVYFGVNAVIINAFLFIGLDLTARDKLHDAWQNNGLIWKMGLLIVSGSFLSWLLNHNVGQIAIASMLAFAAAALVDSVVYQLLHNYPKWLKINGSNIPSALVDSLVFPTIAFGSFLWPIVLGQFVAKVLGGFIWSFVLGFRKNESSIHQNSHI